ncbi:hypothetical protein L579_1909 [Pantoea sp. AS-PWVM4]|uniref:hypothetical protein n=1 Tax=Pantoea sp. AS-PWVM4 TaxID=1332069 RepID=UPI0003AC62D8|nr:hypothetical protein [Pantoea sp. AS-PWVM4]ERK18585.1 hypothetical protein L579_1909 [Pantoea sp. AS-PWVM4]
MIKLKMFTLDGPTIIETNAVTQFSPDSARGGNYTRIETVDADGSFSEVVVKHDFHQVTQALANAWSMEEKAVNHA